MTNVVASDAYVGDISANAAHTVNNKLHGAIAAALCRAVMSTFVAPTSSFAINRQIVKGVITGLCCLFHAVTSRGLGISVSEVSPVP